MSTPVSECCPACGRPVAPKIELRGPVRQAIYNYIAAHPSGVTRRQIFDYVYQDDPNGGPETFSVISVHVWNLNKTLRAHGLRIRSTMGRGAIFRLEKIQ